MKKVSVILSLVLILSLLAGCAGTPVIYYSDCTCPTGAHEEPTPAETAAPAATEAPALTEGELLTGLAIITNLADSKSATAEAAGEAKYDVTVAAVLVDAEGIIRDCIIDSLPASVQFDASGAVISDLGASFQTKAELGDSYGMRVASSIGKEWFEQIQAVADYAVGKKASELSGIAISGSGEVDADLASGATMYVGGFLSAVEKAAANARSLGAKSGDELRLAVIPSVAKSASATAEANGTAQLDMDATALTLNGGVITSCYIDSLQAKVSFDASGVIASDISSGAKTKNELGEAYNMKTWGQAIAEWDEQAASFAAYVTGKTVAEVSGIAVNEETKPTDADLTASVTIAIGGFQALIAKAGK